MCQYTPCTVADKIVSIVFALFFTNVMQTFHLEKCQGKYKYNANGMHKCNTSIWQYNLSSTVQCSFNYFVSQGLL